LYGSLGCVHTNIDCTDKNLCTRDLCCQDNGCYYAPVCCDDNNACTVDSCDPYVGCQNVKISCDDGDECTIDRCHCEEGCQHFPVSAEDNANCAGWKPEGCSSDSDCDDGSACTENRCHEGECHTQALDCDDNDLCTIDACHEDQGCTHTPIEPCTRKQTLSWSGGVGDAFSEEGTVAQNIDNISAFGNSGPTLSVGAIVGIVVGSVFAVGIIAVLFVKVRASSNTHSSDDSYQKMN